MWMECSPGGKLLMSSLILTPGEASVRVAVPMLCPEPFLISTTTGLGAAFAVRLCAAPVTQIVNAAKVRNAGIFIIFLSKLALLGKQSIFQVRLGCNP